MPVKINNRGSEWRRWDLHIHTPDSYLANGFGNDWDNYIKNLFRKALEKEIAAIGITDYFSIDGYEKVLGYQKDVAKLMALGFTNEEIEKIQFILLLANVELRLKCIVGASRVNMHVVFSPEVDVRNIKENFLENLDFAYEGLPGNADYEYKLKRLNLEALGAKLLVEHPPFRGRSAIEIGATNAVVDDSQVTKLLSGTACFANKYMVCTPVDEDLPQLPWDGQDHQTRKVLYQKSDCFFASNPKTIEFGLGKKHVSEQGFIDEFKSLKPCIHGSDAHSIDKIFMPDQDRFCWIKADTTFAGLRQILFDPEERVYIGEMPPSEIKNPANVISQIDISNSDWFANSEVFFNKGLISIIGQKGSGKTALADLIAYCVGTWDDKDKGRYDHSFIKKAGRNLDGTDLNVFYSDPTIISVSEVISREYTPKKPPAIQYLSQQFVASLCDEVETGPLIREIENVIFTYIREEDQLNTTNFAELKNKRLFAIQARRDALTENIQQQNDLLINLYNWRDKVIKEKKAIKEKNTTEIKSLKESLPKAATEAEQQNIDVLLAETESLKIERAKIEKINLKLSKLDELESVLLSADRTITEIHWQIRNQFAELELTDEEFQHIAPVVNPTYKSYILDTRSKLRAERIELIKDDSVYQNLTTKVEELKTKVIEDKSKQIKYQEAIDKTAKLEKLNGNIQTDLDKMTVEIGNIQEFQKDRVLSFVKLIKTLKEEQAVYIELYEPLQQSIIEDGTPTEQFLNFNIKYAIKSNPWKNKAKPFINKRGKTIFDDLSSFNIKLDEYLDIFTQDEFIIGNEISADMEVKLEALITEMLSIMENPEEILSFNLDYTMKDLYNWFFSINHIDVAFGIQFENVNIEQLSPGTRGIVLLLIYLGIDKEDTRPMIIDQPEDNLDNTSVYDILVPYFRAAKQRRQIFLITHNANLVVNTDSEQIIIASMKRQENTFPKITYDIKSLESGKEDICKILEGGTKAFEKRERKYDLQ